MFDLNGIFIGVLAALAGAVVFLYRMWRRASKQEKEVRRKLAEAEVRANRELEAQKEAAKERQKTDDAARETEKQVDNGAKDHFESIK